MLGKKTGVLFTISYFELKQGKEYRALQQSEALSLSRALSLSLSLSRSLSLSSWAI